MHMYQMQVYMYDIHVLLTESDRTDACDLSRWQSYDVQNVGNRRPCTPTEVRHLIENDCICSGKLSKRKETSLVV